MMVLPAEIAEEQMKHPRFAIIPSPEKLNVSYNSPGRDATNTQRDFNDVWQWAKQAGFLNTEFHTEAMIAADRGEQLEKPVYKSLINLRNTEAPISETRFPAGEEMVLLYYAGHGLNKEALPDGQSASPYLDKVGLTNTFKYFEDRTVKGGELCLHDVGFCDLKGLLTPWIEAVTKESSNAPGVRKNKHLVVIADSCYSGVLAQDLEELPIEESPWKEFKENGCTVTVQSACGSDEPTFGGYFTPVFIHLNKNPQVLQELKSKWSPGSTDTKNKLRQHRSLPSPQVAPIRQLTQENDPTMVVSHGENFKLTLFHDPGFFKFCYKTLVKDGVIASTADAQAVQSRLKERSTWMANYLQAMQQNH